MRIRRLRLRNFRTFVQADLEFPQGLCGIVGPNGSGKTTLFEAIGYALYGDLRTNVPLVRSTFAGDGETCEVELDFELDGKNYTILRKLTGKAFAAKAELRSGAKPLADSAKGVTEQMARLLQMDKTTFFASVFARQKQVDALTEIPKGERQAAFRRMLNVHKIDEVLDRVRGDARSRETEVKALESQRKDEKGLTSKRDDLRMTIDKLDRQQESANAGVEKAAKALDECKAMLRTLEDLEKRWLEQRKLVELATQAIKGIESDRKGTQDELEEAKGAARKLEALQPELRRLGKAKEDFDALDAHREPFGRRQSLEEQSAKLRAEVDQLRRTAAPLAGERVKLDKGRVELRDARKGAKESRGEEGELKGDFESLRQTERALAERRRSVLHIGAGGICPTCQRKMDDSYERVVAHFDDELKKVKSKIADARSAYANAHEKAKSDDKYVDRLEAATEALQLRINELAKKHDAAERDARRLEVIGREIETLGRIEFDPNRHAELKEDLEKLSTREKDAAGLAKVATRIVKLGSRVTELAKERGAQESIVAKAEKAARQLGFDPKALATAKDARERAHDEVDTAREQRAKLREQQAGAREKLIATDQDIRKQIELREEIACKRTESRELAVLADLLKQFQLYLTDRIRPALAQRAGRLLARASGGCYDRLELDNDYNVILYDGEDGYVINRFSGGETDLVNLCLRVATAQVVAERGGGQLRCLILDEVFGSQDAGRKELILQSLMTIGEQFLQVFVITHDEGVRDRLPRFIEVRRPPDGVSWARVSDGTS